MLLYFYQNENTILGITFRYYSLGFSTFQLKGEWKLKSIVWIYELVYNTLEIEGKGEGQLRGLPPNKVMVNFLGGRP